MVKKRCCMLFTLHACFTTRQRCRINNLAKVHFTKNILKCMNILHIQMPKLIIPKLKYTIILPRLCQINWIHSMYCTLVKFMTYKLPSCSPIIIRASYNTFIYVEFYFQNIKQKFTHWEQIHLQLVYIEDFFIWMFFVKLLTITSTTMEPILIASALISSPEWILCGVIHCMCQMLPYKKLCVSLLWNPWSTYTWSQICFTLSSKCIVIILFGVLSILSVVVICIIAKTCNMAYFATIVACFDIFAWGWICPHT